MTIARRAAALAAVATLGTGGAALAQAGLLTGGTERLEPPITLSAGQPLAEAPYELETGRYYRLFIEADGSQELAIGGAEFFRNVWVNEVVINDIEVRPMGGIDSIEFDAAGQAAISFVTIRPGTFHLRIPGTTGETQQATFIVSDPNAPSFAVTGGAAAPAADDDDDDDDDMDDAALDEDAATDEGGDMADEDDGEDEG